MPLEVDFYNDKERLLGSMFAETDIPDGVSEIKINGERGAAPHEFQTLLSLLKKRSDGTAVKKVIIDGVQEISPEYLAFLVWIASKTESLEFNICTLGDSGFGCLMSGIVLPNGLKKLDLDHGAFRTVLHEGFPAITTHQATLLFEAVASSSSLETLWIRANFEDLNEMGHALVRALGRNRSLKAISLMTPNFSDSSVLPKLLKTAILQTKVKELELGQWGEILPKISLHVLADVVCRPNCTLESLSLRQILPDPDDNADDTITERNSSVTSLKIEDGALECFEAMKIIRLFQSLKILHLHQNNLSDLTPLDPLLLKSDQPAIEELTLGDNPIPEHDFKVFLKKLPRMNSLRSLDVKTIPALESESCLTALKDAVWLSKSLEHVFYHVESHQDIPEIQEIDSKICLATSLNRGAKRKLLDEYPLSLPQNLWAHVLKRARTIKYYNYNDELESPSLTNLRPDVVFWLLRQKMLC